jgi:hypothetical protein
MKSPHSFEIISFSPDLILILDADDDFVCQTNTEEKAKFIIQKLDYNGGGE